MWTGWRKGWILAGLSFLGLCLSGGRGAAFGHAESIPDSLRAASRVSIGEVRTHANGAFVPARVGDTVLVRGRASTGTGILPDSSLIFLQDETGGVAVHLPEGPAVSRGDSLWVQGVIEHQYGLTRLEALHYERVDALSRFPEPLPVPVSAAARDAYEGRLVRVRGRVVVNRANEGGEYLLLEDAIQNATTRIAVFVPRRRLARFDLSSFEVGDQVDITGVLSQHDPSAPYENSYQVLPRDEDDLTAQDGASGYYQTVILFVVGGALLALIAVLTLRVAVRRRTQQLDESRARFRRLAEATSEGIMLHQDGDILDVNRALTEMTGYSREELTGRPFREVLSASTDDGFSLADRDRREAPYETVVVRKGQSSFPAEIEERVVDVQERDVRVVALRDVTERKRRETELLLAKEEAERMARLKSSLLSNMSHEFRTPITSILGYVELILEDPEADHHRFARHIQQSGRRLSRTLRSVLDMAQLEADSLGVNVEKVDVVSLVRAVANEHREGAAEKGLALDVTGVETCVATTDPRLLRRSVGNLVHNAVKFTQEGRVEVAVDSFDSGATIRVSDTGIGIDPAFQSHIFEPFTQESKGRTRSHEGTGLGLALTERMLELIGGRIEVESEKEEGATFTVTIPSVAALEVPRSVSFEEEVV